MAVEKQEPQTEDILEEKSHPGIALLQKQHPPIMMKNKHLMQV